MRVLLIFFSLSVVSSVSTVAQPIVTVASKQSTTRYYQSKSGSITFPVLVTLNYNGVSVVTDDSIYLTTANSSNAALVANAQLLPPVIIAATEFEKALKEKQVSVNITMNAVSNLSQTETFDILISGFAIGDSRHRVVIDPIPIGQPSSSAQIIHLQNDTLLEAPLERDVAASELRKAWLRFRVEGVLEKDSVVEVELLNNSGNNITTELETKTFRLLRAKTLDGSYTDSVEIFYRINSVKGFGKDETIYLKMKNANSRNAIVFTRSKLIHPNKSFWIEAGSNFDLIDGVKPNNLFAGVFFYKRDITSFALRNTKRVKKDTLIKREKNGVMIFEKKTAKSWEKTSVKERKFNLSILAGIYESRSIGNEDNSTSVTYQDNRSLVPDTADRYPVFKDTGSISQNTTINNLGLFFSPQFRLTRKDANTDGFHFFAAAWFEIIWQRSETLFDYSKTSNLKTYRVPEDSLFVYARKTIKTTGDYRTQYLGVGFPIYIKDGDVNLYFSPIVGFTNQRFNLPDNQLVSSAKFGRLPAPKNLWNPFFLSTFRLSEEKYGLSFTGEVRGLLLKNTKPVISLALSKKFDLAKLLEYK